MADVPTTAIRQGGIAVTPDGALYVTGDAGASIGDAIGGATAGRILYVGAGPVLADSSKYTVSDTAGVGMTIAAGTTADNTGRALSISQTWTDGTTNNIGIVGNFDMGATGTATGKLLSLQAGAAGTTEKMYVDSAGDTQSSTFSILGETAASISNSSGYLQISNLGGGNGVGAATSGSTIAAAGFWSSNATSFTFNSGVAAGWTASAIDARVATAKDTAISRISAGVIGVGTGAAGSMAGTVALAGLQVHNGTSAKVAVSGTAPTLASGGCTSAAMVNNNGTARFEADVGTSCSGSQPLVFTLPATTTGWNCTAQNVTNPATSVAAQSSAVSTTSVTITNYSRTTGLAQAWTDGDNVVVSCLGG